MTLFGILLAVLLWASAFAGIRVALTAYNPAQLAILRFEMAVAVLGLFALFKKVRWPDRRHLFKFALAGLTGITIYHWALNTGEQEIMAGASSLITSTVPIWTVLWATLFLKERLKVWGWIGIVTGFVGVLILSLSQSSNLALNSSALLILLAAVSSSVFIIVQKQLLQHYSPLELNLYSFSFGVLFLSPFSGGALHALQTAPLAVTGALIYLGIFPGALAFILWSHYLHKIAATKAVAFFYLVPITATLIAWLWLNERPNAGCLIGGAVTLAGVIVTNSFGRS